MPGLGTSAMDVLASDLLRSIGDKTDVPSVLRYGNGFMPLGKFLRDKLKERIGRAKGATVQEVDELRAQVSALLMDRLENETPSEFFARKGDENTVAASARQNFYARRRKI